MEAATANAKAAAKEAAFAEQELAAGRQVLTVASEVASNPVDLAGALAVAKAEAERVKAQRDVASAELRIAQREVEWLTVRSPATGVVMKVTGMPGAIVGPEGEPILSLYDPHRLRARMARTSPCCLSRARKSRCSSASAQSGGGSCPCTSSRL